MSTAGAPVSLVATSADVPGRTPATGIGLIGAATGKGTAAIGNTIVILAAGTTSWTVPAGVTNLISIECWGQGGCGCAGYGGAGGNGGDYAAIYNYAVTPAAVIPVSIGNITTPGVDVNNNGNAGGPTWFNSNTTVQAAGGVGGYNYANGNQPANTGSVGTLINLGGTSVNAVSTSTNNYYGGGSSSGTSDYAGNPGINPNNYNPSNGANCPAPSKAAGGAGYNNGSTAGPGGTGGSNVEGGAGSGASNQNCGVAGTPGGGNGAAENNVGVGGPGQIRIVYGNAGNNVVTAVGQIGAVTTAVAGSAQNAGSAAALFAGLFAAGVATSNIAAQVVGQFGQPAASGSASDANPASSGTSTTGPETTSATATESNSAIGIGQTGPVAASISASQPTGNNASGVGQIGTVTANGVVTQSNPFAATGQTGPLSTASTATDNDPATATGNTGPETAAANASEANPASGTGQIGQPAASGTAGTGNFASGAGQLGQETASGSATETDPASGGGTAGPIADTITAQGKDTGSGTGQIGQPTASGVVTSGYNAVGAGQTGPLVQSVTATESNAGSGIVQFGPITAAGLAIANDPVSGIGTVGPEGAAGAAMQATVTGTGAGQLGPLQGGGTATAKDVATILGVLVDPTTTIAASENNPVTIAAALAAMLASGVASEIDPASGGGQIGQPSISSSVIVATPYIYTFERTVSIAADRREVEIAADSREVVIIADPRTVIIYRGSRALITPAALQFPRAKGTNAVLDYTMDWTPWLLPQGNTLASVAFTFTNITGLAPNQTESLIVQPTTPPINEGLVTCVISGGVVGCTYGITATITTNELLNGVPQTDTRTVQLAIVA